jgi:N-acetylglucosamine-6-sulfatase
MLAVAAAAQSNMPASSTKPAAQPPPAASLPAATTQRGPASQPRKRPNIVLIITDDQRFDSLRCTGHRFVETPNIDRLAAEGLVWENAFVVTPLCAPSRATILTGQMTHVHGVCDNNGELRDGSLTIPGYLRANGYATAFVGKFHLGHNSAPRKGLFDLWVCDRGGESLSYFEGRFNVNGQHVEHAGFQTDVLTDYAVEWLRQQSDPFFLMLALKNPHPPLTPPPRHATLYADAPIEPPASYRDPLNRLPRFIRGEKDEQPPLLGPGAEQMHDELKRLRTLGDPLIEFARQTARMIPSVDDAVGRVVAALDELGVLDETVIIFTSDNGMLIGEHGLLRKGLAYEPSIRVPLIVRYPPRVPAGARLRQQALNTDLAPTILDLAGLSHPEQMNGRSLTSLFDRPNAAWRTEWLCIGAYAPKSDGPPFLAIRTERWKYVRYVRGGLEEQLFNIQNDAQERNDLAVDPAHAATLDQMRAELRKLMTREGVPDEWWTPRDRPASAPADGD